VSFVVTKKGKKVEGKKRVFTCKLMEGNRQSDDVIRLFNCVISYENEYKTPARVFSIMASFYANNSTYPRPKIYYIMAQSKLAKERIIILFDLTKPDNEQYVMTEYLNNFLAIDPSSPDCRFLFRWDSAKPWCKYTRRAIKRIFDYTKEEINKTPTRKRRVIDPFYAWLRNENRLQKKGASDIIQPELYANIPNNMKVKSE
jgi:hypothetical protein